MQDANDGTLVITLKENERLFIGGGIVITCLEVGRDRSVLSVLAPRTTPLLRERVIVKAMRGEGKPLTPEIIAMAKKHGVTP